MDSLWRSVCVGTCALILPQVWMAKNKELIQEMETTASSSSSQDAHLISHIESVIQQRPTGLCARRFAKVHLRTSLLFHFHERISSYNLTQAKGEKKSVGKCPEIGIASCGMKRANELLARGL